MLMQALVSVAARRVTAQQPRLIRQFHASGIALARQSRRVGRTGRTTAAPSSKMFDIDSTADDDDDDDAEDGDGKLKKSVKFYTKDELEENPNLHMQLDDGDDDDEHDEETKAFLKEVDELFVLDPTDFDRRLSKLGAEDVDFRGNSSRLDEDESSDHDDAHDDEQQEEQIERAERIPKKRLLRMLEEVDARKVRVGKNAESMQLPKTKANAPLEKKDKKMDPDRITYRQERVGGSVAQFVQKLLLEDCEMTDADVFAHIADSSASPDLRRIVLYWEPARISPLDQPIAKKKVEGVQKRIAKLERWIRMSVTRHMNLKYAPIIQFKRYKEDENKQIREVFDQEMAWLERFK